MSKRSRNLNNISTYEANLSTITGQQNRQKRTKKEIAKVCAELEDIREKTTLKALQQNLVLEIWPGFAHYNRGGAGTNNAFGSDFAVAGRKWTEAFCNADSDGDGLSNGQELGDPECVWRVGEKPSRTEDITHPASLKKKSIVSEDKVNTWNSLPRGTATLSSLNAFKNSINGHFGNYKYSTRTSRYIQCFHPRKVVGIVNLKIIDGPKALSDGYSCINCGSFTLNC
ncbi:temptin precursor [Elysia marginata]|uniref:Temptin n=1 Tax=Elysia marginata TaxID=1093978 RepID=A0AAV4ISK0_9GAST|nr:temptin precursor [Elysia marginata]